jgi:hypothetical protein
MTSGLEWVLGMIWMNIVMMGWINVDEDEDVMTQWRGLDFAYASGSDLLFAP